MNFSDLTMLPLGARRHCRGAVRRPACGVFPRRGMARRKTQNPWLRIRRRTRRAPSGAPHALKQRSVSACYLAALSGAGPAFALSAPPLSYRPVWVPRLRIHRRERRQPAFEIDPRVVSQLLAGPRSGPGGSPTSPREPTRVSRPAGTPPPVPLSQRLATAPHEKDEVVEV